MFLNPISTQSLTVSLNYNIPPTLRADKACQDCQDRCGRSTNQVTNSVISTALRSSTRQLDPAPMIARGLNVRRAKQMPAMLHRLMSVNTDARRT